MTLSTQSHTEILLQAQPLLRRHLGQDPSPQPGEQRHVHSAYSGKHNALSHESGWQPGSWDADPSDAPSQSPQGPISPETLLVITRSVPGRELIPSALCCKLVLSSSLFEKRLKSLRYG